MTDWVSEHHLARHPEMRLTHLDLGYHPVTRDHLLTDEETRFSGMYAEGKTGTGKSGWLQGLIYQDAARGFGTMVLDPHGDLVDDCIAALPPDAVQRAYVLDMTDEEYPFGINLFTPGASRDATVDRIRHIFEVLWPEVKTQLYFKQNMRAATITLLDNPGSTLVDMWRMFKDKDDTYRDRMAANVRDESVREYWADYDQSSPAERDRRLGSLKGRLDSLFMGQSRVRNIVGQSRNTIDLRKAMEAHEIVFIKLPANETEEQAELIGTFLVAQTYAALFSWSDTPQAQRPGMSLYVDEFKHFVTPDFESMITEGRKFGIRLVLAHQFRDQINQKIDLRAATLNCRTIVAFQVQHADARELAPSFPSKQVTLDPKDISPHACADLLERTHDFPEEVQMFVEMYLRPISQTGRATGQVPIKDLGFHWVVLPVLIRDPSAQHHGVKVPSPLGYLDRAFYAAMRTGDPNQPLDEHCVLGFSNIHNPSFYQQAIRFADKRYVPQPVYPDHLVVMQNGRQVWSGKQPEGASEWLWHCIFCIRQTMAYLAQHPLGESKPVTAAAVAQLITDLPTRTLFVRTGDKVGTLYTHHTPPKLVGEALAQRMAIVRNQTRLKYCRPREDVESEQARGPRERPTTPTPPSVTPPVTPKSASAAAQAPTPMRISPDDPGDPNSTIIMRPRPGPYPPQTPAPPPAAPELPDRWEAVDE